MDLICFLCTPVEPLGLKGECWRKLTNVTALGLARRLSTSFGGLAGVFSGIEPRAPAIHPDLSTTSGTGCSAPDMT
jgi:hypothetical protein